MFFYLSYILSYNCMQTSIKLVSRLQNVFIMFSFVLIHRISFFTLYYTFILKSLIYILFYHYSMLNLLFILLLKQFIYCMYLFDDKYTIYFVRNHLYFRKKNLYYTFHQKNIYTILFSDDINFLYHVYFIRKY